MSKTLEKITRFAFPLLLGVSSMTNPLYSQHSENRTEIKRPLTLYDQNSTNLSARTDIKTDEITINLEQEGNTIGFGYHGSDHKGREYDRKNPFPQDNYTPLLINNSQVYIFAPEELSITNVEQTAGRVKKDGDRWKYWEEPLSPLKETVVSYLGQEFAERASKKLLEKTSTFLFSEVGKDATEEFLEWAEKQPEEARKEKQKIARDIGQGLDAKEISYHVPSRESLSDLTPYIFTSWNFEIELENKSEETQTAYLSADLDFGHHGKRAVTGSLENILWKFEVPAEEEEKVVEVLLHGRFWDGTHKISLWNEEAEKVKELTRGKEPKWSPINKNKFLFKKWNHTSEENELYIYNLETEEEKLIFGGETYEENWTRDGRVYFGTRHPEHPQMKSKNHISKLFLTEKGGSNPRIIKKRTGKEGMELLIRKNYLLDNIYVTLYERGRWIEADTYKGGGLYIEKNMDIYRINPNTLREEKITDTPDILEGMVTPIKNGDETVLRVHPFKWAKKNEGWEEFRGKWGIEIEDSMLINTDGKKTNGMEKEIEKIERKIDEIRNSIQGEQTYGPPYHTMEDGSYIFIFPPVIMENPGQRKMIKWSEEKGKEVLDEKELKPVMIKYFDAQYKNINE